MRGGLIAVGLLLIFVSLLFFVGFVYQTYNGPSPPANGLLGPIIGFTGFIVLFAGLVGNPDVASTVPQNAAPSSGSESADVPSSGQDVARAPPTS